MYMCCPRSVRVEKAKNLIGCEKYIVAYGQRNVGMIRFDLICFRNRLIEPVRFRLYAVM